MSEAAHDGDVAITAGLRELREARGLSIAEMVRSIGISRQTLWRLETGRTRLTGLMASKIAGVFQVAPGALREVRQDGTVAHGHLAGVAQELAASEGLPGLKWARLRRGWSLRQLAARVGASTIRLVRWERGETTARAGTVRQLAVALEVEARELTEVPPNAVARALDSRAVEPHEWGTRLQELRAARGLTQRALATRAGVSREVIGYVERGRRRPQPRTMRALSQALGIPPEVLIGIEPITADRTCL